jgi:hypothetical protein
MTSGDEGLRTKCADSSKSSTSSVREDRPSGDGRLTCSGPFNDGRFTVTANAVTRSNTHTNAVRGHAETGGGGTTTNPRALLQTEPRQRTTHPLVETPSWAGWRCRRETSPLLKYPSRFPTRPRLLPSSVVSPLRFCGRRPRLHRLQSRRACVHRGIDAAGVKEGAELEVNGCHRLARQCPRLPVGLPTDPSKDCCRPIVRRIASQASL